MGINMEKSILWISACVPYDKVPHAGGKIHNYYLKYLKSHSDYKIKLLSFYWDSEKEMIDLDKYGIDYDLIERRIWHLPDILINTESVLNPWNRYAGINQNYTIIQIKKRIAEYVKQGLSPDVVILQWTEMIVLIDIIKEFYPDSIYIGIEEEVKFLGYERKATSSRGFNRVFSQIRYSRLKAIELSACSKCDRVILNNFKDLELLVECGVKRDLLTEWQPYFDSFIDEQYIGDKKQVVFYGAMWRIENIEAAIFLIKEVLPLIKDKNVEILIIGSSPPEELKKLESDRVHILGFVDSIKKYLKEGACFAAPLRKGAGIKIKILEAMSAGIPILTTGIGIEGIRAENGKEYYHCTSPQEYAKKIDELIINIELRYTISNNQKAFIKNRFDLKKSGNSFIGMMRELMERGNGKYF